MHLVTFQKNRNFTSAKMSIKNTNIGQAVCCWYEQQHK